MASQPSGSETSRERLLHGAMEYVAAHGVADLSLRGLAAAIGTSHRMLIYHFGSKEGLLVEVVRAVEAEQRELLANLQVDPALSPTEVGRRMWAHLADPALWPSERLFFETYGQALQGRSHAVEFLDDAVESWLGPAAALRRAQGVPEARARAVARLDLAVTRGLLLDLLATKDRAGADAAMEHYIEVSDAWRTTLPGPTPDLSDAGTDTHTRLLLVSGSLRRASTNKAVLETARAISPPGVATVRYGNMQRLPPFNPDDAVAPLHPAVVDLRAQIHDADAVLFSVPEYAGGLPGAFKNLLDWTIGDDEPRSIYEKPVAWINASVRTAADAHASLRTILGYAHATIVDAACAHIPVTTAMIGPDGLIDDPSVRDAIAASLTELVTRVAND